MEFYVSIVPASHQAKVHKGECGHCRRGRGLPKRGRGPGTTAWSGPYATREQAFAEAQRVGQRHADGCGHCKP